MWQHYTPTIITTFCFSPVLRHSFLSSCFVTFECLSDVLHLPFSDFALCKRIALNSNAFSSLFVSYIFFSFLSSTHTYTHRTNNCMHEVKLLNSKQQMLEENQKKSFLMIKAKKRANSTIKHFASLVVITATTVRCVCAMVFLYAFPLFARRLLCFCVQIFFHSQVHVSWWYILCPTSMGMHLKVCTSVTSCCWTRIDIFGSVESEHLID